MPFGLILGHAMHQDWWRGWYPETFLLWAAVIAGYLWLCKRVRERYGESLTGGETGTEAHYTVPLFLGMSFIFLSEGTPVHTLAENYLLSVHMVQHVLLFYLAAPLLVLAVPGWLLHPLTKRPVWDRIFRLATNPIVALVVFNGQFAFWHLPRMYQAALWSHEIHMVQHVVNMIAALMIWWPVLGRSEEYKPIPDGARMIYLFFFSVAQIGVYAYITFNSQVLYPFYANTPRLWGVTLEHDQVLAGIAMQLGTMGVLVTALAVTFFRWARREERKDRLPSESTVSDSGAVESS